MSDLAQKNLGKAILDRKLLEHLETLWDGPVSPDFLDSIEQALRAFLVQTRLVPSKVENNPWLTVEFIGGRPLKEYDYCYNPLSGSVLQWAFEDYDSEIEISFEHICNQERRFLEKSIDSSFEKEIIENLPKWIKTIGEAYAYIDLWYSGASIFEITKEEIAFRVDEWYSDSKSYKETFKNLDDLHSEVHAIFHLGPSHDAQYFIGSHRAGLTVYGNTPVINICKKHLFSKWPNYLFENFGERFCEASRLLKGPGTGIMLPPLTLMVLSRANSREAIPETIFDMRDEYKDARTQLWDMLQEMWNAKSFKKQMKILKTLCSASNAIFGVAFDSKFDALSLGISAIDMVSGGFSGPIMNIKEQRSAHTRITAVSFAKKLSIDFKKCLLNNRSALKRHFTDFELKEFGVS